MTSIEVLQNIVEDYLFEEEEIENALQKLLLARSQVRNNKNILLNLIEELNNSCDAD